MKLDPTVLRYLNREEFRTLTAIEQGMKNHELVPTSLICSIARLKHGGAKKCIATLHKYKLLYHEGKKYDGYRLNYMGYDFLCLKTLSMRGVIKGVGTRIGVGKESDIFIVIDGDDRQLALKLHRLGRTSFRSVKNNRDYLEHRKSASWIYLSRLAALKEYAFMKALFDHDFPVPEPIEYNRHGVLMTIVDGYPLCQVKSLKHPARVFNDLMNLIVKLAQYGLIHCDFNEFNILINDDEKITLIDFPQMVSTSHPNAEMYFNRDVECIKIFFSRRFHHDVDSWPKLHIDGEKKFSLDVEVAASGFTKEDEQQFEKLNSEFNDLIKKAEADGAIASGSDDDDYDDESDEEISSL